MRRGSVFGLRGIAVLVIAMGLMATEFSPASAQTYICVSNPTSTEQAALEFVDTDDNGIVTAGEIQALLPLTEEGSQQRADLEAALDDLQGSGASGLQLDWLNPCAATATATETATTAPETPTATTTPVTPDATTPAATTTPETPGATTTPDATTPAATTTPETPGATTTPVTPDATTAPDNGDDDDDDNGNGAGDDDGVTDLPETGQGPASDDSSELVLLLGAASAMMLAGGFAWQRRRIA